jgi:hypothetical protein
MSRTLRFYARPDRSPRSRRAHAQECRARYSDGRVSFGDDLITGRAAEVPLDEHRLTTMLQWLRDGRCVMRTLIDERKVSDNWIGH